MKVVYKEPRKPAEVREIENELSVLQELVDGYIETAPWGPNVIVVLNEEGKLRSLEPNIFLHNDVLVGNIIFLSTAGEDFCSLDENAINELLYLYG